ncbi:hypothetical protein CSIRO_2650 [Bradyrhizobiaceae bacterium SG-6C]|nr:hypothetical protein CSIRO_2650 [Bradyrhizobiaceae bacterium SG-6C]
MWFLAVMGLAAGLAVPFFLIDLPPVLDYPNHLARYVMLAHPDDPVLSQMYTPRWGILPNIGMDALAAVLLKFSSPHTGGRLLLALSLFAPVVGVVAYSRVAFGRFTYWPLASGLVAWNAVFFLGFMNFLLSAGLAFGAAALWIALDRQGRRWLATFLVAIAVAVIFFCHIFGVLLTALLIGSYELSRLVALWKDGKLTAGTFARTVLLVAMMLAPALALYLVSPLSSDATPGTWNGWQKALVMFAPFTVYSTTLTVTTGVAAFAVLILVWRQAVFAQGIPLALVALGVVFLVAPSTIKGGTFVEARLALMFMLMIFAGILPRLTSRQALAVGTVVVALSAVRTVHVAAAWVDHRQDLTAVRAAIADVKPGSRVLVARGHPGHEIAGVVPQERALPGMYRLDGHLGALLLIERRAFWPLMFADPAQQPMTVKPPYDRIAHPLGEPVDWPLLHQDRFSAADLALARYLPDWRGNFDDVLLIDPPTPLQPLPGLSPVAANSYAVLYRIQPRR